MVFKIQHDKKKCISCGACAAICPENWEMKTTKAAPKETIVKEIGCNKNAADACPVKCIKIVEK